MYSRITYTGNGSNKTFTVPFTYLNKSYVEVYVNTILKTETVDYNFTTPSSITFVTAPANGTDVFIKRNTTKTTKLVSFTEGSILTASNLDLVNGQMLDIAQEVTDDRAIFDTTVDGTYCQINTRELIVPNTTIYQTPGILGTIFLVRNSSYANKLAITDTSTVISTSSTTITGTVTLPSTTSIGNVSDTEIGYLDGVTSSIQNQLNTKLTAAQLASVYTISASAPSPSYQGQLWSDTTSGNLRLRNTSNTAWELVARGGVSFGTANGSLYNVGNIVSIGVTDGANSAEVVTNNTGAIYLTATSEVTINGASINIGDGTTQLNIQAIPAPTTSTSAGVIGEVRFDSNYMYRCVATNTWKRVALSSW